MAETRRLSTGVPGLDTVLDGGLIAGRNYMVRGGPGSGKTILGFHFLEAGTAAGETGLFINLEEDLTDLKADATALGFDVDAITYLDRSPSADAFADEQQYDVFVPTEVERGPLTEAIVDAVEDVDPDRVVVDPVTQLRHVTSGDHQFHRQVVGLMRFLKRNGATVLSTVQRTGAVPTDDLEFVSDGTIQLGETSYGRTVTVPKFRGSATRDGEHTYRITGSGLTVYPALEPGGNAGGFDGEQLSSGVTAVDDLLHGGIERGTVTVVSGPTGAGKTTLGLQFASAAAGRGERAVVYLFEESESTLRARCRAVGMPVDELVEAGTLRIEEVEAVDISPQEFDARVREAVDDGATFVMIDGIAGYRLTLRGAEETLLRRVHTLGRYLRNSGVTTLLLDETRNVTGDFAPTRENVSYLADNIVFLRHLELDGEIRKAIGVLKKRASDYERTLREFEITESGLVVGDPLTGVRGILTGQPETTADRDGG